MRFSWLLLLVIWICSSSPSGRNEAAGFRAGLAPQSAQAKNRGPRASAYRSPPKGRPFWTPDPAGVCTAEKTPLAEQSACASGKAAAPVHTGSSQHGAALEMQLWEYVPRFRRLLPVVWVALAGHDVCRTAPAGSLLSGHLAAAPGETGQGWQRQVASAFWQPARRRTQGDATEVPAQTRQRARQGRGRQGPASYRHRRCGTEDQCDDADAGSAGGTVCSQACTAALWTVRQRADGQASSECVGPHVGSAVFQGRAASGDSGASGGPG